jgi:hypothetical protein
MQLLSKHVHGRAFFEISNFKFEIVLRRFPCRYCSDIEKSTWLALSARTLTFLIQVFGSL